MEYSVVVIGGGPSGALAALRLVAAGVRVLVIDRERPGRPEAAEILSPDGHDILAREKLWNQMPLDLSWPCTALAAAWESPEPVWTSFATHPKGCAWHIDRVRFDAWLTGRLQAAGATVARGGVDAARRSAAGWQVEWTAEGSRRSTSAAVLILATGRSSRTIRPAPRRAIDHLCLVAGTSAPDPVDPDALIVEAVEDGWWYSAPLVTGRLFSGWMTDFALVTGGRYRAAAEASLAGAPLHTQRVGTPRLATIIGSAAWALTPAAGPGWIAVGDAALARDPISGDGLTAALRSALHASDVVVRALNGDDSVWAAAAADTDAIARQYEQRRLELYRGAQKRWPASPFWRRFDEVAGG